MHLDQDQLAELANVAIEAATAASEYIGSTRPKNVHMEKEGDGAASQILTEVDEKSQEIILGFLNPTLTKFDLGLLAEESADDGSRLVKDHFWCIDPIDGTLPFVEGIPGYSVSIALVAKNGESLIGVVGDPVEKKLYHAIKGKGAFRDGQKWIPAKAGSRIQIFTDRSTASLDYCKEIARDLDATVHGRGGAVMNAIWCYDNPPACYFKFPKTTKGGGCFWDFAATACIGKELEMVVEDMNGNELKLNDPESIYLNRKGILYATDQELRRRILDLKETL